MSKLQKAFLITFAVLLIDQIVKIWVKTTMMIGEEHHILGNRFIIHFIENEGMAFGWKLGFMGAYGKLFLSLFRLVAIGAIIWYIRDLAKKNTPMGVIASLSLILAGAAGNMIDSAFYGLLFNESMYQVAEFMPEGGGYAGFLYGHVVDMLYFPLLSGTFPDWIPWIGGDYFVFFRPVFNIADASVTCGGLIILLFQRQFFSSVVASEESTTDTDTGKEVADESIATTEAKNAD